MKIGILTQPLNRNYGGVLQAWALQQILIRMGHYPEIISRTFGMPELNGYRLIRNFVSFTKSIVVNCYHLKRIRYIRSPFKRDYNPRTPEYCDNKFVKFNIVNTPKIYSDSEFDEWLNNHDYDAFIVGSDQVWREEFSPRIESFFLDFLDGRDNIRKISYSASFGIEEHFISQTKLKNCVNLLKKFDAVSVREDSGLRILRNVFDRKDAIKVLDPTLLLNSLDYLALINVKDKTNNNHIAGYILDNSIEKRQIIKDLSVELNLPVNLMTDNYGGKKMSTISQWLANIAHADFVITDSFHGCVFSIIFNKPFIAIGNLERGLDRFNSLLESLNLSNRLIGGFEEYNRRRVELMQQIDYATVKHLLIKQQETSLEFLHNALSEDFSYSSDI